MGDAVGGVGTKLTGETGLFVVVRFSVVASPIATLDGSGACGSCSSCDGGLAVVKAAMSRRLLYNK